MKKKLEIIAEAGVNHCGKLALGKKLCLAAKKSGADYVKFQIFKAENLVLKNTKLAKYQKNKKFKTQFELLKNLELKFNDFLIIKNYCKKIGIKFLCTPFDISSANFLKSIGIKNFKISSPDLVDLFLIKNVINKNNKIILSTGMANLKEIKSVISYLKKKGIKNKKICIMHCTSFYPAENKDLNLLAINVLKKYFKTQIGYSDHSNGYSASIAAVALGARIIEKHITLDKNFEGPDHKSSLNPIEFKEFVSILRKTFIQLGLQEKICTKNEKKIRLISRKSIIAKKIIKIGEKFSTKNITFKRPGSGISPLEYKKILGKKSKFNFKINQLIKLK